MRSQHPMEQTPVISAEISAAVAAPQLEPEPMRDADFLELPAAVPLEAAQSLARIADALEAIKALLVAEQLQRQRGALVPHSRAQLEAQAERQRLAVPSWDDLDRQAREQLEPAAERELEDEELEAPPVGLPVHPANVPTEP